MERFVRRCFCGKLLLDLAHLRQAKNTAHASWVGAVFGGQVDHHADGDGPDAGDDRGAEELCRCRQVFDVGFWCVVHFSLQSLCAGDVSGDLLVGQQDTKR